MSNKNEATVFECNFINAPLSDRLMVWGYSVILMLVLTLISNNGHFYIILTCDILLMLIPIWFEFAVHMIRTRSFITLTDKEIVVKRWMSHRVSYPIDKIECVRVVDFDTDHVDKLTQYYRLPMPMGRVNLYPQKGVIVFFDRKWIKSVHPVFFNPANTRLFAQTLAEISGKTPISDCKY